MDRSTVEYEHGRIDVASLVPYARNARTHSKKQVDQLAASIKEWGFTSPVLIDENGGLIAGHGRTLAAKQLGLETVPFIRLVGLSEAQRRAYVLADNKLALNSGWDDAMLKSELAALEGFDFSIELAGFSDADLAAQDPTGNGNDPDAPPAVETVAVTRAGDVWRLGSHRVLCGDGSLAQARDSVMAGGLADLAWTDPPYNVAYETAAGKIDNDDLADAEFRAFLLALHRSMFEALKPGGAIYVAHADTEGLNFRGAFRDAGFKLSGCLVWRKDSLVLGRSDYQWIHEPILYGWKPGHRHRWYGGRKQTTLQLLGEGSPFVQLDERRWQVTIGDRVLIVDGEAEVQELMPSMVAEPRPRKSALHPTMKPVALIERGLRNSGRAGDVVLDYCGGSGSTLIAAHRLGMSARLIELSPLYVDVIVRRWQEYTGEVATREVDGLPFAEC